MSGKNKIIEALDNEQMKKDLTEFSPGDTVIVKDKMQTGYSYEIVDQVGNVFSDEFRPKFSPQEMLEMGIFEGKYFERIPIALRAVPNFG